MEPVMLKTGKDDWETPQDFFDKLNNEFHFTLDPCADDQNHKCEKYYTIKENGLLQSWAGEVVFCNPPYSRRSKDNPGQERWIQKAYDERKHATIVMLLPVRTDTKAFHRYIKDVAEIRFIEGRIKFVGSRYNAPFPNMVVIFEKNK